MYVVVIGFVRSRLSPKTVMVASPPFTIVWRAVAPVWSCVTALPALRLRFRTGTVSRSALSSAAVNEPGLSARGLSPASATSESDQSPASGICTRALSTRLSAAL